VIRPLASRRVCTIPLVPKGVQVIQKTLVNPDLDEEAVSGALSEEASDFLGMVSLLRGALGDARGKIRVVDVQSLAGLDRPSYYRMSLIARALRHLGWKRSRYRFNGVVAYGYARGTRFQREEILDIEPCSDGQFGLKKRVT
jgi:hypothetical protein